VAQVGARIVKWATEAQKRVVRHVLRDVRRVTRMARTTRGRLSTGQPSPCTKEASGLSLSVYRTDVVCSQKTDHSWHDR
jgi:hypothetical protein